MCPAASAGRKVHDRLSALITLCGAISTHPKSCHWHVETFRTEATAVGLLVPMGIDPTVWPLRHARHGWVLLDDDGGWTPTKAPKETP